LYFLGASTKKYVILIPIISFFENLSRIIRRALTVMLAQELPDEMTREPPGVQLFRGSYVDSTHPEGRRHLYIRLLYHIP
jgi:hypothetical protein